MGFKEDVYCLVFLLTITSAITEDHSPTPTKSTEMELSVRDINPEAPISDFEPTSSTALLSSSVVAPGPNCTSNPQCPSPWEGENWTDNAVNTYTRVTKCTTKSYYKMETTMECAFIFIPESCKYKKKPVMKTSEGCYCKRGSRKRPQQNLLKEEIEGKAALSAAGFCELGSNNSHDIVLQVVAPPKKQLVISVRNAYINCTTHKLTIRDSPCGEPHTICGQVNNTTIISTTGRLQIKFQGSCQESSCSFDANILFIEDPHGDDKC